MRNSWKNRLRRAGSFFGLYFKKGDLQKGTKSEKLETMTSPITVKKLSHCAITAINLEDQVEFYTELVGLTETGRLDDGSALLRCNEDAYCLMLKPSQNGKAEFDHLAMALGSRAKVEAAADVLSQEGIPYEEVYGWTELGQDCGLKFTDPDGFHIELVAGMEQILGCLDIRAVTPRRFGHITLRVADPKVTADFYTSLLGFRISDWLGEDFVWMRCTPEHHGLAVSRHERAPMVHHIAFHVRDIGELVQQAEHLVQYGRHLLYGPGRHGPGQNLFIYFEDPEGMIVEFAADMQRIWDEESYRPKVWNPNERWSNMWGPPADPRFRE